MINLEETFKTIELSNKFFTISIAELGLLNKQQRNRELKSKKHINDLYNGIVKMVDDVNSGKTTSKVLFESKPLIISLNTLNMLDAQNRCAAMRKAYDDGIIDESFKVVVYFEDIPEEDEYERIVTYNTIVKSWQLSDFIEANLKVNTRYEELRDFANKHELLHSTKINKKGIVTLIPKYRYAAVCIGGKTGGDELKRGNYTHTDKELKDAKDVHDRVNEIIEWLGWEKDGAYIEALFKAYHMPMDGVTDENENPVTWGEMMDMDWLRNNVVLHSAQGLKKTSKIRDMVYVFNYLYQAMCSSEDDYYRPASKTELAQRDNLRKKNEKKKLKKSA